ncbi:MAG: hypothetical protein ACI9R3_000552 [Verrucomicrobiales bacterium]
MATLLNEVRFTQSPSMFRHHLTARALLRRLAELSPDEAVDFCNSYVDDNQVRHEFLTLVAEAVARTNIDRALLLMPSRSDNRRAWLTGLVVGVGKDEMDKVLAVLPDADNKRRRRLMERFDPNPSDQLVALTSPSKASAHLAEIEEPASRAEALNKLLEKVGPIDLSVAIALILDHSDIDWHLNGMFVIAPFRLYPEQTISRLLTLPQGKRRDELLADCLFASTGIGPEVAQAVASAIDDEDKRTEAVRQHALQISWKDPDAALQLAAEFGLKEDLENELQVRALHKQISDGDPIESLVSIALLPKGESQDGLLLSAIRSMPPSWGVDRSAFPKGKEADVLAQSLPLASGNDIPGAIGSFLQYWIEEDTPAALQAATTNSQLDSVREEIWRRAARH